MFRTIVLALDGSEGSRRAAAVAAELAHRNSARLVIAHVAELVAGRGGGYAHLNEDELKRRIVTRPMSLLLKASIPVLRWRAT